MTTGDRWRDLDAILEAGAEALAADYLAAGGDVPSELAGDRIGRYRLLELVGRGGMGAVWRAERADGEFDHRVALKLVKRGMDTDEILARFRRERQILARLEHPNIGRILDGGAAPDGRPYFVMEYVDGRPITEHCDEGRLTVEDRLRLFVAVCRTVQHAHRNLVVHRDLKPGNVMVNEAGEVKLLDFGIARVLQENDPSATIAGPLVLTPEYASPEQLRGETVTTASDVYQLGALLYELLTGRPPASAIGRPGAGAPGPIRPSTTVGRSTEVLHRDGTRTRLDPARISGRRGSTPQRLRRRLRGDLDAIVLAALRPDPEDRPPSADALADDVERHLAHRPIRHGGGRLGYEARKFARRHVLAVGTAAATTLLVAGLIAYYTVQLRGERDGALREAEEARVTADLVERFFEGWSPDAADRGQVTTEEVLADAVRRADRELADQPTARATALSVLGSLYTSLGALDAAEPLFDRALEIQERAPSDPDLAATLARHARLLGLRGDFDGAERSLRQALEIDRRALGPNHPETLRVQRNLAAAVRSQTRYAEAEALLRPILAALGPGPTGTRSTLATETAVELGYVLFMEGRYDEAASVLRPALAEQRARYGEVHAAHLYPMRALASALRDRGDLEEAEALYREAMEITRALYGEEHEQMIYAATVLSLVLQRRGELEEAEEWARRSLEVAEALHGDGHLTTAGALSQLAAIRLERGDPRQAEPLLRLALHAFRRGFPDGHPDEGDALNRLAWILGERGAPEADAAYAAAIAFDRARPPGGAHFVTDGYHYLAGAALRAGDPAAAEALYRRALGLYRRQLPEGHHYRAAAATGLGATLAALGRTEDGARYLREGLQQWSRARPPAPERVAEARTLLERAASATPRRRG